MFKKGDVVQYGPDFRNEGWRGVTFRIERMVSQGLDHLVADVFVINPAGTGVPEGAQVVEWRFYDLLFAGMKKIGEGGIYVGQRVKICPESIFYGGGPRNPANSGGVVRDYGSGRGRHPFSVLWDNGSFNVYKVGDLIPEDVSTKPKPKVIKKSPRKQIMEAVKILNDCEQSVTAKYCILYEGEDVEISHNKACHAGLYNTKEGAKAVVSCIKRGVDEHPWFYKWLIDESPWRSAFHRRYAWSRKNKVVVVRTDISNTFMFGALFATRIWEDHVRIEEVKKLKSRVSLNLLYPISCMIRLDSGGWGLEDSFGGHFPFNHTPGMRTLSNFIRGKVVGVGPKYSEVGARVGVVNDVFGEGGECSVTEMFREFSGVKEKRAIFGSAVHRCTKKTFTSFLNSLEESL